MKQQISIIFLVIGCCFGSYSLGLDKGPEKFFTIIPTTVGDDSIVNAIKEYSDITKDDVNNNKRAITWWNPFQKLFVRRLSSAEAMDKIKNYMMVCMSLTLAQLSFPSEDLFLKTFPINWTPRAICAALKNLKEQGMASLALLAQMGITKDKDPQRMYERISEHIKIIDHNRNLLKSTCAQLSKKRSEKQEKAVKDELALLSLEEKKWKNISTQVKSVVDVDKVIEIVKRGIADSLPTALLSAMIFYFAKQGSK